jgi:hypothetical protein
MLLSANDLEDLYHSNLYINVATMQNEREVRGRLVAQSLGPAHELADHPILIAGETNRLTTRIARFFLIQHTKMAESIPNGHKVDQIAVK